MVAIKIRQLIDLAIGYPETGQVNFAALHCLLLCMAEKLAIKDDTINYDEIQHEKYPEWTRKSRLIGGLNPEDNEKAQERDEISVTQMGIGEDQQAEYDEMMEEENAEEVIEAGIEAVTDVEPPTIITQVKEKTNDSELLQLTVEQAKEQMTELDILLDDNLAMPSDLLAAISVLKQQLEFALDQLLLLTFLTLSKKPDSEQIQQLYDMAQTLNELKKQSVAIKGLKQMPKPMASALSLNWMSSNLKLNEGVATNHMNLAFVTDDFKRSANDILEDHLCYSPAKLLDQLMTMKSEFCLLTNKVNEISAHLLNQESHQLLALVQEAHKQIRDLKLKNVELKENHSRLEQRVTSDQSNVENLQRSLEDMKETMVDKSYFDMQMANKVDHQKLQSQASLDQLLELQCRGDKKFNEIFRRFNDNDKRLLEVVENLKATLGPTAVQEVLANFKETMSSDMQQLNELLRKYIESTNDECAAAGGRVKMLQDLVCLSCNTTCVMPVREKAKVGKLPSAYASSSISPLVTYELGSIRKSGIMGYYRKDEFPHSPNAWLAQQSPAAKDLKQSPTRQAGGQHTINSAKERFQKIMFNRK